MSSRWPLTDRAPGARPFLGELTGLRFLAALWVLGFHTLPRANAHQAWQSYWGAGYSGVTLFFVLSGFVLVYTYGPLDDRPIDQRAFLIARIARLYPMYLVALLIGLPEFFRSSALWPGGGTLDARETVLVAISTPVMLQAWLPRFACSWNCPGWSLSAEAFFYLVFPFVAARLLHRSSRVVWWLAASTLVVALLAAGLRAFPPLWVRTTPILGTVVLAPYTPFFRLPEFLFGMMIGRWYLDRRLAGRALHPARGVAVALVATIAIVAIAASTNAEADDPMLGVALLIPFGALILGLGERGNRGLLARPIAMALGEASYAFYLIHGPLHVYVLGAARRLSPGSLTEHPWIVFAAYVALVTVASLLLYRYLERPARLTLRRRLAQ